MFGLGKLRPGLHPERGVLPGLRHRPGDIERGLLALDADLVGGVNPEGAEALCGAGGRHGMVTGTWEEALSARLAMSPGSPAAVLDALLKDRQ